MVILPRIVDLPPSVYGHPAPTLLPYTSIHTAICCGRTKGELAESSKRKSGDGLGEALGYPPAMATLVESVPGT